MRSIDESDFGTPAIDNALSVTLSIDGHQVTVPAGTSLMRAAAMVGIVVPKLCATDSLEPFGSCRLCLVQVEGMKGTPASCTTPAAAGMQVTTQNDRLADLRRNVMELYVSDHPLDCLTCPEYRQHKRHKRPQLRNRGRNCDAVRGREGTIGVNDRRLCRVNSGISGANVVSEVRRAGRSGELSASQISRCARHRAGCQASLASVRNEGFAVSRVASGPAMLLAAGHARRV